MKRIFLTMLPFVNLLFFSADTASAISWSTQTSSTVSVVDIGSLGGGNTYGYGINDSGQVTGKSNLLSSEPRQHAFLWSLSGSMQDLSTFNGTAFYSKRSGMGINNSGQITGDFELAGSGYGILKMHAFFWDGYVRDIGTLGGYYSSGQGINNYGFITGFSSLVNNTADHAFVYNSNTYIMTDIGTLGGSNSAGYGINDSGFVTGYSTLSGDTEGHAFVWNPSSGNMIDLGSLGGTMSFGQSINNSGQVAGYSYLSQNSAVHAFLWNGDINGLIDLGTLGGSYSYGRAVNDSGLTVGSSSTVNDEGRHAFVYDNGTMYDLNSFVQLATGEYLDNATAINELSQIVATSNRGKTYVITPTETCSPVPVPSSGILFSSSVALLAMLKRRR